MTKTRSGCSPIFDERSAGFLSHLTSLPGSQDAAGAPGSPGSGDLGCTDVMLSFASKAGLGWWQMLPIHPPNGYASPYQSRSCFAGHSGLIDLASLVREGWLSKRALSTASIPATDQCDFARSQEIRKSLLMRAFGKFDQQPPQQLARFKREQKHWLADWALFEALIHEHNGAPWSNWEPQLRDRAPAALRSARKRLAREIRYHTFVQYVFDLNWQAFRSKANQAGVKLLGDLPKFVAADSADAWVQRNLFYLDTSGLIECEAGTPPDAFTRYGQRWGVPTYRVPEHRKQRYSWWIARVKRELQLFDALRLDHFIGYARTYSIPAAARSQGSYVRGLGRGLFDALVKELGPLPFLVEDLGDSGPDVEQLRKRFGFPGTKVLQFGLDGLDGGNPYLPHNWTPQMVAYSGTHDNPTSLGWFKAHAARPGSKRPGVSRRAILEYTGGTAPMIHNELRRLLWTSVANTVIMPVQDLLGLGASARMNIPGRAGGNWGWRLKPNQLDNQLSAELHSLGSMTGRLSKPAEQQ